MSATFRFDPCTIRRNTWLVGWMLLCTITNVVAQDAKPQAATIPFRRVFVPQDDLKAIGVDELIPVDVELLGDLIRKQSEISQAELAKQGLVDSSDTPQLRSTFYIAKLIGADLVSERSHLTYVGDNRFGERITLAPWSLAIQPAISNIPKQEMAATPVWTFNERGEPQLTASFDSTFQRDPKDGQYESTFGWSAKAVPQSTPNKLRFSLEIPSCINSCLILALPPQAEVQESSTVVQRVADWSQIARRLSSWNDFSTEVRREASTGLTSESLWLIELGGSQSASFAISLSGDSRSQNALPNSEGRRYEQLVRSQSLQHFVEGEEIRTVCEAEVFVTQEQRNLRLSIAPGTKLRRLTVNQLDVDWKVEEDWIVAATGAAVQDSNSGSYVNVVAEFISSFSTEHLSSIETATPSFERGYVMSGSTVIHNSTPWRLTHVKCDASRIVQPIDDARASNVSRIEYSWSTRPPKLTLGLERMVSMRRCETLTRLSNDEKGTTAVIHARLLFREQDSSYTNATLPMGWQLLSFSSMDSTDPAAIQAEVETPFGREFQMKWDRVQKSRVAEIELHLFREAEEVDDQPRKIDCQSIFGLPGWQRSDTFALEQDEVLYLDARDDLLDRMISEDLVSDWQKPHLPRANKAILFRTDSQNGTQQLVWRKYRVRHLAKSQTEVERTGVASLRASHEIQLELASTRHETVTVAIESKGVIWKALVDDRWIPLAPLPTSPALTDHESGLWFIDIRTLGQAPKILAVVNSEIQDDNDVVFPVPMVLDFDMVSQVAKSISKDVMLSCDHSQSVWTINEEGFKTLKLPVVKDNERLSVSAKASKTAASKKWFFDASELHVVVDSLGSQKASLRLHANVLPNGPVVIELENGWEPLKVVLLNENGDNELPVRLDGQRLVISRQFEATDGSVSYRIDFIGPTLPRIKDGLSIEHRLSFTWPIFRVDADCATSHRSLWLPAELQVDGIEKLGTGEKGRWQLWDWSRQVFGNIFGFTSNHNGVPSDLDCTEIRGLVPNSDSNDWRLAIHIPNHRSESNPMERLVIGSALPNRTLLGLFFCLALIFTPRLLVLRYQAATWFCAIFIVLAHFAPSVISHFAFTGLIGMFAGYVGTVLYELLQKRTNGESSLSQRNSAKWSPWNDRQSENESGSNHLGNRQAGALRANAVKLSSLGLLFATCTVLVNQTSPLSSMAFGQSKDSEERNRVFQVLLPINEAGDMVGTTAYVPQAMLDELTGKRVRTGVGDRGTQPLSAKYSLRVGLRGRFNSADQLAITYEFLVGDDLAPVRFPVNATQLLLPRFSVDGMELNLGNRLRSNGTFWTWTPDRPGKKTVQIIAQPVLKQIEQERYKDTTSQLLDIAVLPVANAAIEIQTDSKNSVDIVSRGKVTDPEVGRFVAMLGGVARLNCSIRTPTTKSFGTATSIVENGDFPTMHTELFLQNDILQAKTIVDFPRSHSFGNQVEIEADVQWLPVGIQWGDAQLTETRPGSNLFRRRYVLDWKTPTSDVGGTPLTSRDRQISVIWVPQTTTQSLNVLFAECLERGTRRGTLRFARSNPSWSIEGISTWIPAIGSKDRLDWPELKTNLLALSLRIPPNGGFGILKPKSTVDKPQQARITTKWSIEQSRELVSSMITWFGSNPSSDPLVIELPEEYQVTELYNRSGPIRFLQSTDAGKNRLQILADHRLLEASDLWIQARRQPETPKISNDTDWRAIPWVELPKSIQSDQSLEIQASERIAVNLESVKSVLYGKGVGFPIHLLQKSSSDHSANASLVSRFQMIHRDAPLTGTLQVKFDANSSKREIAVNAQLTGSMESRPYFVLEVPYSFKDRWQSESKIVPVQCPDESKAWLQVHLPEPIATLGTFETSTVVQFPIRSEDPTTGLDSWKQIRALDPERIPTQIIDSNTESELSPIETLQVEPRPSLVNVTEPNQGPAITMAIFQVRDGNFMPTPTKRFVLLESQYWLTETKEQVSSMEEFELQMGETAEALFIEVDNKPVPFWQEGNVVRCVWQSSGLCSDMRIYSKHEMRSNITEKNWIEAPRLIGFQELRDPILIQENRFLVSLNGTPIPPTAMSDATSIIAQTCLEALEKSKAFFPKLDEIVHDSDFDAWRNHWIQKSIRHLEKWASHVGAEDQLVFGEAVERFNSMKSSLGEQSYRKNPLDSSESNGIKPQNEFQLKAAGTHSMPWFSFFGCLMILVLMSRTTRLMGAILANRPWWSYLLLGLLAWVVTGSVLPTLVLGTIGLVVAADCYWMVTSRLRRIEIRGLR